MKILITGGAGFIGSHLADRLIADGHDVTAVDDLSTGSIKNISQHQQNSRFKLVVDTILNAVLMDEMIAQCDQIYHLAAAVGVKLIMNRPVET